jgi:DNA-binding SARP family transcriptional activator
VPPADLRTVDLERVTARVRATLAPTDTGALQRIAEALHRLTGGWESLVDAVLLEGGEPWALPDDPVEHLARPGGRVAACVEEHLLGDLDEETRTLLGQLAGLRPLPRALVADLAPCRLAGYDELVARGLIGADSDGLPQLVPLVSAVLLSPAPDRRDWLDRCARWFEQAGRPGAALHAALLADDRARCARLVEAHGDEIATTGWARDVIAALPSPPDASSARLLARWGHAARVSGRPLLAERALEQVVARAAAEGEPCSADVTWRLAQVKYGRGDLRAAVRLCRSGPDPRVTETVDDRTFRLAGLSVALRALGELDDARRAAEEAVRAVRDHVDAVGDAPAAMALMVQGLLLDGARRLNLLAEALTHAELAGDLVLTQRVLVNLSDAHLVGASYAEALLRADQALALVHRIGPVGCYAAALHNRGEALLGLGDLPAARTSFLRCLDLARRHGVARTPAALHGLAEVDYESGLLADAEAGLREAADLARETDDAETLAPALARLATILATRAGADDVDEALELADLAVDRAEPDGLPTALVARGWAAVAAGDPEASAYAEAALAEARTRHVRRALGEALELRAATTDDPRAALAALEEAIDVHERSGSGHRADRVRVTASRLPQADRAHRAAGRAALRRLRRSDGTPTRVHPGGALVEGHAIARVLGPFQVQVDGRPVAGSAWRSRQARTLLKILLSRNGRPVSRDELCELLWPDDDPARTGHRLSVLLSTLRSALDPARRWPTDRFLVGDTTGIRVATEHVTVDLHDFLADADDAAALADAGEEQAARALLRELLQEYGGEAFEDDPFEAWAQDARDHARNVHVQCLRTAAVLAGRAGDIDQAITLLTRLLGIDPYDEPAHRLLVSALDRARRHGEARRAHERWVRANTALGLPAPPAMRSLAASA